MEDTNKKHNKTPQEEHVNFQETKEDRKYNTHFENAESEIAAKNEQTVQKCALRSEEKVCKKIPTGIHGTTEKQVTPNFANDSTETIPENVLSKGSNSSDTHNINENGINPHSMSDNSSINKPCCSTMDEFTCGKQASVWLGTPTNFIPTNSTTHKTVRKRHMGENERSKQSEHEFVIHHEHCENLDSVSKKEDSSEDTVINADQHKISLQGIKSELNHEPVELPEDLIKDLTQNTTKDFSLFRYLQVEVTRRYLFEEKEEKYLDQREKVYTFMKTPRELEKLMWFGFLLCLDCFLFVFTYLPVRVLLALIQLLGNVVCLKFLRNKLSLLEPHQTCDMLRGFILLVCCAAMNRLDLSILYHIVRGQSVIKLYVIYNMLDIADRLFSSIGQDTLDALFWTAAAPRQKRRIVTIVLHFGLASVYVFLHAVLVLFQAITLNVAINSHNKVLMVVMVSNQFVELKGSVFKKFEKNNLFQMSCSDIRERFYYVVLVSLVTLRNMHELQWNLEHLYELIPSVALLLFSEVFVDWVKHAFITKFNCISSEVYREYRELLALDAATSRLFGQRASSDHFDLVSRRLGFIPLPLACVVYRVTSQSVKITGTAGIVVLVLVYLWLTSVKILNSIILLGLSSHYVINKTSDKNEIKPAMESSPSPSDFQLPVADPLDRDPNKLGKVSKPRQVKALNEIDRYTLCSNRIV